MKIALVCTQGGHLTQLLRLMDAFQGHEIFLVSHYSPRDDELHSLAPVYLSKNIGKRFHRIFFSFLWAVFIIIRERPKVVISTGAEIAIPFFFWAKLFRIRTLFLESWSRISEPSRTGRIVYYLSDEFWVQWPQLLKCYGSKAKYHGAVV